MQTRPIDRWHIYPGMVLWFRCDGVGDPLPVRILNPGPLGQCRAVFLDETGREISGGVVAVNPSRELHEPIV